MFLISPSELQFDNTNFVHLTIPPKHEYIIIIIIIINFAGSVVTTCYSEPPDALGTLLVPNGMTAADAGRCNDPSTLQYFSGAQTRFLIYPLKTVLTFKNDIIIIIVIIIIISNLWNSCWRKVLIFTVTIKRYPWGVQFFIPTDAKCQYLC